MQLICGKALLMALFLKLIILTLALLWIGSSLAKSVKTQPEDYDYVRMFPNIYRGRNDADSERPTIQKYWQNFVRNIPFPFNMTNSIGNLFNAGTQSIIEAPVGVHEDVEPNRRRRKSPKRKSSIKKSKSRRRSHARDHRYYYNYGHVQGDYRQLQLQPIGMDESNVMHFYDTSSGSYYALQMVSPPGQYYTPSQSVYHSVNQDDHDSYYVPDEHDGHHDHEDHDPEDFEDHDHEDFEDHDHEDFEDQIAESDPGYDADQHHSDYDNDNEDYNETAEAAEETNNDYADDIQIADNWGYTDEDIFGERKLKVVSKPFPLKTTDSEMVQSIMTKLPPTIVTFQKHILKPENEEDVKILLTEKIPKSQTNAEETRKPPQKRIKPNNTPEDADTESVRNVLGSFMKDDSINRRRQSTTTKTMKRQRFVERPRQRQRYFIYPHFW